MTILMNGVFAKPTICLSFRDQHAVSRVNQLNPRYKTNHSNSPASIRVTAVVAFGRLCRILLFRRRAIRKLFSNMAPQSILEEAQACQGNRTANAHLGP